MSSIGHPRDSAAEAETVAIGRDLARGLRRGDLLALHGPLGAGKTCLVRGLAAGLGADPGAVRSPTFVLHQVYRGHGLTLHHVDCYRLGPGAALDVLDVDGLLEDGAVAAEWAEFADLGRWSPVNLTIEVVSPQRRVLLLDASAPVRLEQAFASRMTKT